MNSHYANCQCQSCRLEAAAPSIPDICSSDRLEDLSDEQLATLRTQLHQAYGATLQPDQGQADHPTIADGYQLEIRAMGISTRVDSEDTVAEVWEAAAEMEAEALRVPGED